MIIKFRFAKDEGHKNMKKYPRFELSQEWTGFNIKTTTFVYIPSFFSIVYFALNLKVNKIEEGIF